MRLYPSYLGVLALAIFFVGSPSAFELFNRQRTSVAGNFTSMSGGSAMTASDNSSSTATTRMIATSGTFVSSQSALHGPTSVGTSSTSATATGGSSSGQGRAFEFSTSVFMIIITIVGGFMAFNMA